MNMFPLLIIFLLLPIVTAIASPFFMASHSVQQMTYLRVAFISLATTIPANLIVFLIGRWEFQRGPTPGDGGWGILGAIIMLLAVTMIELLALPLLSMGILKLRMLLLRARKSSAR